MTFTIDPFKNLRFHAIKNLMLANRSGYVICDLGCGEGLFIRFAESFFSDSNMIIGVDVNSFKIKKATSRATRANFLIADIRYIPLRHSSCDLVSCSEVIEHLKNEKLLFKEVKRVLKPQGSFFISTPNIHSLSAFTTKIAYRILGKKYTAFDETHINLYWPDKLLNELKRFSFENPRVYGLWLLPAGFSWPPLLSILLKQRGLLEILSKSIKNRFLANVAFITIIRCKRGT